MEYREGAMALIWLKPRLRLFFLLQAGVFDFAAPWSPVQIGEPSLARGELPDLRDSGPTPPRANCRAWS